MRHLVGILLLLGGLAQANPLVIAVGESMPPFFIDGETPSGLELDILKAALEGSHELKPMFVPYGRAERLYLAGRVDAYVTTERNLPGFYSLPHITYENVAVTLKSRAIALGSLDKLAGMRVHAFQHARSLLGEPFAAAVNKMASYQERGRLEESLRMLEKGRLDVVVVDINILRYLQRKGVVGEDVAVHFLFPTLHLRLLFRGRGDRDSFNEGLQRLRAGGGYYRLQEHYLGQ
ncbi:ABC-type amino acid transport/signal transduction systems [Aeromonas diversa CDC 2478-85]|uniref:ABC-type amino acid transport/signal transduction systems n=1 Tax=Aeromonas diversa CDC 2478-85 TaxID=1268237 RepID=N9V5X7_9GAMM|nr:transporter substrate-binding domain-containing protein [Aeromonas diversa]ENY70682.1 ABC-type amino acid transport/signal transduction systems [Aeromonas diversa CDC 2478-85]